MDDFGLDVQSQKSIKKKKNVIETLLPEIIDLRLGRGLPLGALLNYNRYRFR